MILFYCTGDGSGELKTQSHDIILLHRRGAWRTKTQSHDIILLNRRRVRGTKTQSHDIILVYRRPVRWTKTVTWYYFIAQKTGHVNLKHSHIILFYCTEEVTDELIQSHDIILLYRRQDRLTKNSHMILFDLLITVIIIYYGIHIKLKVFLITLY